MALKVTFEQAAWLKSHHYKTKKQKRIKKSESKAKKRLQELIYERLSKRKEILLSILPAINRLMDDIHAP